MPIAMPTAMCQTCALHGWLPPHRAATNTPTTRKIGKTLDTEAHVRHVQPALLPLFAMNDRAVRMQLLQKVDEVVLHMDDDE